MRYLIFLVILISSLPAYAEAGPAAGVAKTKVAFLAALTGMDPNTSRELTRGVQVFQAQMPKLAGLMDISINDTKGDLEYTYESMAKLKKEGYSVFVGLANSNEAMVAAKFTASNDDVLFLTPFATNTQVTEISDRAFRVCFDDAKQGAFLAAMVNRKFPEGHVLILENIDSLYSKGLSGYFKRALAKGVRQETASYTASSFEAGPILAAVEKFKPAVVFIPDSSQNAATVVREIFRVHKDIQFVGGDGWGGNAIFHAIQGKDDQLKILYSTYWHTDMPSAENQAFQKTYGKLFSESIPSSGAAFTYDAFHLLGRTLEKVKRPLTSKGLAEQIKKTSILSTTGPLEFTGASRTPDRPIVIMQLQKGKYVVDIK